MYSTADIHQLARRGMRIRLLGAAIGLLGIFGCFGVLAVIRDPMMEAIRLRAGETIAEVTPYLLVLPSIAFFIASLMWAEKKSDRYNLVCRVCGADQARTTRLVLVTRCCSECKAQIVTGHRTRKPEVFERLSRLEERRLLIWWFWIWPCLGLLTLGCHWIFPSPLATSTHMLFVPGLVGIGMTGWTYFRTHDKGFVPQFVASALVFGLGFAAFCCVEFST